MYWQCKLARILVISTSLLVGCGVIQGDRPPDLPHPSITKPTTPAAIPAIQAIGPGISRAQLSQEPGQTVIAFAWSPDSQRLATLQFDQQRQSSIRLWDGTTGQLLLTLLPPASRALSSDESWRDSNMALLALSWSPDGQILASGGASGIQLWSLAAGKAPQILQPAPPNQDPIWSLAWSPDGQTLAAGSFSQVMLWRADLGKTEQSGLKTGGKLEFKPEAITAPADLGQPQGRIDSLSWSPDGQQLAIAGEDRHIHLWNSQTGQLERSISAGDWTYRLSWSPDGQQWAVQGENLALRIWDAQTGKPNQMLSGFEGNVAGFSWHRDRQKLAIGLRNGGIELWNSSGVLQQQLTMESSGSNQDKKHSSPALVSWSPDGKTLASSSSLGLQFWHIEATDSP